MYLYISANKKSWYLQSAANTHVSLSADGTLNTNWCEIKQKQVGSFLEMYKWNYNLYFKSLSENTRPLLLTLLGSFSNCFTVTFLDLWKKSQKQQETWQYVVQSPPSELQRGRVRTAAINLFVFVKLIHSKRFFPSFSSLFHSLCPSSICPDNECLLRLPGIFSR